MITTYDSNCMKCMNGALHPFHDNGTPAEAEGKQDRRFTQLPPEKLESREVRTDRTVNVRHCATCHCARSSK